MYKLMEQEKTYLELLKETKMLKHVGSGPVDPAPKEKETKSPVEDGTGAGTKQASTGHPNVIPPIAYLKKELAKEGVIILNDKRDDVIAEITALPDDQKAIVKMKLLEMKDDDKMCPECDCDPCECDKDDDKKKVAKVAEQAMAPTGDTEDDGEGEDDEGDEVKADSEAEAATEALNTDLEIAIEHCGRDHSKDKKKKISEFVKTTPLMRRVRPAPKYKARVDDVMGRRDLGPEGRKNTRKFSAGVADVKSGIKQVKTQRRANQKEAQRASLEKELETSMAKHSGKRTSEQYDLKTQARMASIAAKNRGEKVPARQVPGSPAAVQAARAHLAGRKQQAFEKKRAEWNREQDELPFQVQNQRRAVSQEQWMKGRGSTSDKNAARVAAAAGGTPPSRTVAGSPSDQAAKAAAFEKQKAVWTAQSKAKAAALPPDVAARKQAALPRQVQQQRRDPVNSVAPTEAPVRTTPGSQSLR